MLTRRRPLRALLFALAALLLAALFWAPPAGAWGGWRWPVDGPVLTGYRNGDDPYAGGQHRGIDIGAPAGARVVAATGGSVTFAGVAGDSGLTVGLRTADGRFDTSYLHLGSVAVRRGDALAVGDALGTVGTSGRRSVAQPHLHFGVRDAGERHGYRDPLAFLPPPAEPPGAPRAVPIPVPVAPPLASPLALPAPATEPLPAPRALPIPATEPSPAPRGVPSFVTEPSPAPRALPAPAAEPTLAPPLTPPRPAAYLPANRLPQAGPPARRLAEHAPRHGDRSRAGDARPASDGRRAGTSLGRPRNDSAPSPSPSRGPRSDRAARLHDPRNRPAAPALAIRPATAPRRSGGLDLGWLAACLGLVAVAMLLGRPRGPSAGFRGASSIAAWATTSPRRSTTSTRSRI